MRQRGAAAFALLAALACPADAQDSIVVQAEVPSAERGRVLIQSPVLVIDSQRLFSESLLGQRIEAEVNAARAQLQAENDQIAEALRAEELELTQRRPGLAAEEFRALADAFDSKAQRIRGERAAELQQLGQRLDQERQAFLTAVVPVLEEIMREAGAAILLEQREVLLHVRVVDVTRLAIERVNEAFVADPGRD